MAGETTKPRSASPAPQERTDDAAKGAAEPDRTQSKPQPKSNDMGLPMAFVHTIIAIAQVLIRTIFMVDTTKSQMAICRNSVHASAIFLIFFIVTHAIGNMTAFISGDEFNKYGHKLQSLGPLLYAVEAYLFIGFAIHASTGWYITITNKNYSSLKRFSLAMTGSVISTFVFVHVRQFRFGAWYKTTVDGKEMRDLWKLQLEVFADKGTVAFYEFCVLVLCIHLFLGWSKAVEKLKTSRFLPNEAKAGAVIVGNLMAVLVSVCFMAVPVYTHVSVQPDSKDLFVKVGFSILAVVGFGWTSFWLT